MASRDSHTSGPTASPRSVLSRLDQAAVAVVLAGSLSLIAAWWLLYGWDRGGVIDIDRAEPQPVLFQLDVNTANWPELSLLPGVGEVLARRIVDFRQRHGPFVDHDDLRRVPGIGPKTLAEVKRYLLPLPPANDLADR